MSKWKVDCRVKRCISKAPLMTSEIHILGCLKNDYAGYFSIGNKIILPVVNSNNLKLCYE